MPNRFAAGCRCCEQAEGCETYQASSGNEYSNGFDSSWSATGWEVLTGLTPFTTSSQLRFVDNRGIGETGSSENNHLYRSIAANTDPGLRVIIESELSYYSQETDRTLRVGIAVTEDASGLPPSTDNNIKFFIDYEFDQVVVEKANSVDLYRHSEFYPGTGACKLTIFMIENGDYMDMCFFLDEVLVTTVSGLFERSALESTWRAGLYLQTYTEDATGDEFGQYEDLNIEVSNV